MDVPHRAVAIEALYDSGLSGELPGTIPKLGFDKILSESSLSSSFHNSQPAGANCTPPASSVHPRSHRICDQCGAVETPPVSTFQPTANSLVGGAFSRRETIHKQRIDSEQRRRDELRNGYARLKDTLPDTNQKSDKVCLLDRATNHIRNLEIAKGELEKRLEAAERAAARYRRNSSTASVERVHARPVGDFGAPSMARQTTAVTAVRQVI
ncbi:hypothetical protein B0H14DRAFT_3462466 [Mycena olivaceomarginata]|nr:hypothetical protein B0H14DRAFT_3462466 [Mycena olivaceomarginata]